MALKLSTGLRNFLLGEGNIRKAFENGDLPGGERRTVQEFDRRAQGNFFRRFNRSQGG